MVGAFFWGIFAVFSPYCPSAGFYNLWGQPTSNFKRLCDFERDGERERGRDGWMVFGCLRGEVGLRWILLGGATVGTGCGWYFMLIALWNFPCSGSLD
ncbi:unnamed protein product [Prunus armeniaca]|uniref:Uncharacterized protein n=1 Tax=Prunus armeniaca TaxID=36596 RepID=A0A6J5VFU1_PRUAR|nr:unnamed protein product [Prunus armeniaca]CAB4318221.1 unnamed protein product [Prunus armeniaca]